MTIRKLCRFRGVAPLLVLAAFALGVPARAGILDRIVRQAGRVADDVPLGKIDDLTDSGSALAGRKILDAEGAVGTASRTKAAKRILREAMEGADGSLLKQVDQLDGPLLEASVAVAKGSREVARTIPDLAARGRFLREGGVDALATLGRYEDLAADAIRFDAAARAGKLLPTPGRASIGLQDFGRFFATEGDRAKRFWDGCVRPHWKLWLGGSALAAVMATPDAYLDAAGDMTKTGIEKLGGALGSAISKAVEGAVIAVKDVVKAPVEGVARGLWASLIGDVWGGATLALAAIAIAFAFARSPLRRRLSNRAAGRQRPPETTDDRREFEAT